MSQLVISDVSRSYAGQLSCYAHNDAGSTSDHFAVVVHCKQNFTSPDGERVSSKLCALERSKFVKFLLKRDLNLCVLIGY